jgi:hypothetical protein
MNKINLEKISDFIHNTYNNYYDNYPTKQNELENEIAKIQQNISLNEKGNLIKYNFIDLKSIIKNIEYNELVLIYPICFNIDEHKEWFNLLNCLLLVLNSEYLKQTNIMKKSFLKIANIKYKNHLSICDELNEQHYKKIADLTNINLIILTNENNLLNVFSHETDNNNKWIVCYKTSNNYFPVWNWENYYFNNESSFIKYLQSNFKNTVHDTISESSQLVDNTQIKKNNDAYEEVIIDEDCAMYISEINETIDQKIKKNTDKWTIVGDNKKKSNKQIFIALEQKSNQNLKNKNKILTESIFKKTEEIDKKILISNVKTTMKLEQLQSIALQLGLSIISGSTREGKPKNKTKTELINEIKGME